MFKRFHMHIKENKELVNDLRKSLFETNKFIDNTTVTTTKTTFNINQRKTKQIHIT